jgi:hypothetical protein
MKTSLFHEAVLFALVAISSPLGAQTTDALLAKHRAVYTAVERGRPSYRHAMASLDTLGLERQSTDGGRLTAYCERDTIRLLVADYYGETGDATYRFYLDRDSLVFVLGESRRGRPDGRTPYPKRTIVEHERFYFSSDRLVRWLDKKNGAQAVMSAEARERAADLLKDVRQFRAAMPACHPKYAP